MPNFEKSSSQHTHQKEEDLAVSSQDIRNLKRDLYLIESYCILSPSRVDHITSKVQELTGNPLLDLSLLSEHAFPSRSKFLEARELVDATLTIARTNDPTYTECCEAYGRNDQQALVDLLPNVLKVSVARFRGEVIHGVTFRADDTVDSYLQRIQKISANGILPTSYEKLHAGVDPHLRPVFCTMNKRYSHGVVYFTIDSIKFKPYVHDKTTLDEEVLIYSPCIHPISPPQLLPYTEKPGGDEALLPFPKSHWNEIAERLGTIRE